MTTVTFHRRPKTARRLRPKTGRTGVNAVDVIAASVVVIRPLCISAALVAAAVWWPAASHADNGDVGGTVLNSIGIGNNGPVSSAIAQVGTSICPMLVQPGSSFATNAAQMSGNGGLAAPIAGWVVGMAIQTQCPAVMTKLANGDLSDLKMLTGGGGPAPAPFGLPGANPLLPNGLGLPGAPPPAPGPFGLPGAPAPAPTPFGLPGAAPPAPSPLGIPGL
jgi:hypothetical protein